MNAGQSRPLEFKIHLRLSQPLNPDTYDVLIIQTDRYAGARGLGCRGGGSALELRLHFFAVSTRPAMEGERATLGKRLRTLPTVAEIEIGEIVETNEGRWP